jgi:hypothetical protein
LAVDCAIALYTYFPWTLLPAIILFSSICTGFSYESLQHNMHMRNTTCKSGQNLY